MSVRSRVRRALPSAIAAMLVFAGIALCAYPAIAESAARRDQAQIIAGYDRASRSVSDERRERLLAEAERYNAALAGDVASGDAAGDTAGGTGDGGASQSSAASPRYEDLLDPNGDEVMGVLAIPVIDLKLPVFHGVGDRALAAGVGHVPASALPIGGTGNHSVIAGHRGLPSAELFTRLDELERGDVFTITVLGDTHTYRVIGIRVVDPDAVAVGGGTVGGGGVAGGGGTAGGGGVAGGGESALLALQPGLLASQPGRDLVTLLTCTPYGVNTHRLLVTGERDRDLERAGVDLSGSARSHTIRIPASPDAWLRSGWAAALAVAVVLAGTAVFRAIRVFRVSSTGRHRAAGADVGAGAGAP
ncbi:class C sortase [Bifidobacterium callitrichos]|uniref:Class C sortase n=1 Tax=Bifidobacterium callitrichos TaxID=762209 RepID=A0A5M9ZAB4_9BIFI|nr:class C sortase [Bifidobacterium callitrichos]KAA8815452.1 class C sortase [Bifidobacterium callitrichos]